MAQIKINNLTFQYDSYGEDIFKNVSIVLDTNWKLGLVGRNGRGKTTLLKLLMEEYKYSGQINSSVEFDYFPMEVKNKKELAINVMREVIAPFDKWESEMEFYSKDAKYIKEYGDVLDKYISHDGYIINELIEKEICKIGLKVDILDRIFDTLSQGEQTKLLLAALFLRKDKFLLIDEPTNHLDADGRKCVSEYLNKKKGFILVSHDRNFIDEIVDHIMSINKSNIDIQNGNYSTWYLNNERRDNFEKTENEKLLKEIDRLKIASNQKSKWSNAAESSKFGGGPVDRGYIGHKAAKMMKRSKSLEKRQNKAIEEKRKLLKNIETVENLLIHNMKHEKNIFINTTGLQIKYDNKILNKAIDFELKSGERIWLKGKNGSGKSSIIKLIIGEKIDYLGNINVSGKISYVSQSTDYLKGKIEDFVKDKDVDIQHLKSSLIQLGFKKEQFEKNIGEWSEGQKKKLLIATSLCEDAEIYIWDEPLNFVDIISRIQIENMIIDNNITMIFVEHDEYFGQNICTKVVEVMPK